MCRAEFPPPDFAKVVNRTNYIQLKPGGGFNGFHGNEKHMTGKKGKKRLVSFKMRSFEQAGRLGDSQSDTPWGEYIYIAKGECCVTAEL